MMTTCPHCGNTIFSAKDNFCTNCGHQLRELSPEEASLVPPEDQRKKPMPVIFTRGSATGFVYQPVLAAELRKTIETVEIRPGPFAYNLSSISYEEKGHSNATLKQKYPLC